MIEALSLDLDALPREMLASFSSQSSLVQASISLRFERSATDAIVAMTGEAKLPFRSFLFEARSVRSVFPGGSRLELSEEKWSGGQRVWSRGGSDHPEGQFPDGLISALELPLALRSTFERRERRWTAAVVAGGKLREISGHQRSGSGDDWIIESTLVGSVLGKLQAEVSGATGDLNSVSARLPLIGEFRMRRDTRPTKTV